MKLRLINATPHPIDICPHASDKSECITIPTCGNVARVKTTLYCVNTMDKVKLYYEELACTDLPKQRKGVFYVVSKIYFDASDRMDICHPATTAGDVKYKKIVSVPGLVFKTGAIPKNKRLKLRY